jgi:GNAT superfamily N-acetyltransferase
VTDDTESIRQRVSIEPFDLDSQVSDFRCGKESLDEFINTDQARTFQKLRLGRTKLVHWEGNLAGYYTLAPNTLTDDEYVGEETEYAEKLHDKHIQIPAQLLGRLAVDQEYQGRGLGSFLLDRIIAETIRCESPFRVILLHAHRDVTGFYEERGFVLSEVPRNSDRDNKIMISDLGPITRSGD